MQTTSFPPLRRRSIAPMATAAAVVLLSAGYACRAVQCRHRTHEAPLADLTAMVREPGDKSTAIAALREHAMRCVEALQSDGSEHSLVALEQIKEALR